MALDIVDTVRSSFEDLNNHAGRRVIGAMIGLGLLYIVALASFGFGIAGRLVGTILLIGHVVAAFSFAVGSLRSMTESVFRKEHYTENFSWPASRMLVSGLVNGNLSISAGYAVGILGFLATMAFSTPSSMGGLGGQMAMLSAMSSPLMQIAMVLAVAAGLYVATTMVLSLPLVATEDLRLFESLDQAVQRSKGNRGRMFVTVLPVFILMGIGYWALLSGALPTAAGAALFMVLSLVGAAYHISLLAQLAERL